MKRAMKTRKRGLARLLTGLVFVSVLLVGPALGALAADDIGDVIAQETPYVTPEITEIDPPSWLEPLQPLSRLPLWGQAAILSAGVAGLFFLVPMVGRWVWRLGEGRQEEVEAEQ